jgi:TetR/AcrR family acrAB operon transcriptional repressor
MTDRPRRAEEIAAESRRRLLDAAEALFASKGYEKTSLQDIADATGISRGSIPWHFENKAGLLMAVVQRAQQRALRDADMSPAAPFGEVMSTLTRPSRLHALNFMLMTEAGAASGSLHQQFVRYYEERRAAFREYADLAEVPELPATESERSALAALLTAVEIGLSFQALVDEEGVDVGGAVKLLADLVRGAYGWT